MSISSRNIFLFCLCKIKFILLSGIKIILRSINMKITMLTFTEKWLLLLINPFFLLTFSENGLSNEETEEQELIKKIKNGNKFAFNILMERYQKRIYYLARKIVINHADADDVVQETFLKAYVNISSFSEEYKFYTWLYRITINTALTLLKKRKRHGLSLEELTEEQHFQYSSNEKTDQMSKDIELKNMVKRALKNMSPQLRTVFILRTSEEMSYKEIAQTLNISIGTVMSRLNRARNKLQKLVSM